MRQPDSVIEEQYPPEGAFRVVDGWQVHHVTRGTGRDVLLLHGAGGSTRDMTFRLMPALLERGGLRVTAIDRPGHGYTAGPAETLVVSPLEQAALIWRMSDRLGLEDPVILGQSYGGAVALAMEMMRPGGSAGLCLVSAACTDSIPSGAQGMEMLMRLDMIRSTTLTTIASDRFLEMAMSRLFTPEPVTEGYTAWFGPRMTMREKTFRHHMMQVSSLGQSLERMMPHYRQITAPVEILHGLEDDILDHDRHGLWLSRQIAGSRLTSLPGAGHMPHQTRTEDVARAVIRIASGG